MADRRPLLDGLKSVSATVDPAKERDFVYQDKDQQRPQATQFINRVPISTRLREDFSKALKRASLERQLKGIEPNTLQDILEEAIEPWLIANGYLTQ